MDRLVHLGDHWDLANAQPPVLLVDPIEYDKRTDQVCAALVDFPLSMLIEQHAQHSGNYNAQLTYARDRMKAVIVDMNDFLIDVILDCKRNLIGAHYKDLALGTMKNVQRRLTQAEKLRIHAIVTDIVIEQPCTPLATIDEFIKLWEFGSMDQKEMTEQCGHTLGIPIHKLKVTKLKRQRELEMEQSALAKSTAEDQRELGEKKIKVDAKKAAQKPAAGSSAAKPKKK
jgi:hypothetical protein